MGKNKKIIIILLVFIFFAFLGFLSQVSAAETGTSAKPATRVINFVPQVPLPGFPGGQVTEATFGQYLAAVYIYFCGIVGILATVMIIAGGLQWITAAGNQTKITSAKSTISGAVIGFILALSAYLLFININPALVKWTSLSLPEPQTILQDIDASSVAQDTEIQAFIGGPLACGDVEKNLVQIPNDPNSNLIVTSEVIDPRLVQPMIDKLLKAASLAKTHNMVLKITGAYRSYSYQSFLYTCWQYRKTGQKCPTDQGCGKCNLAAYPDCNKAPHMTGQAADVCYCRGSDCSPCSSVDTAHNNALPYNTEFQSIMKEAGLSRFCGEWWHFELVPKSTPGCPGDYTCKLPLTC